MNFVMSRDRVVTSTMGRSIRFKAGVPVHVPSMMQAEVIDLGAEPTEKIPEPDVPESKEPKAGTKERTKAIEDAYAVIVKRNRREDFTAQGYPHLAVIATETGFKIDAAERDATWVEYSGDTIE